MKHRVSLSVVSVLFKDGELFVPPPSITTNRRTVFFGCPSVCASRSVCQHEFFKGDGQKFTEHWLTMQ